MTSHKARGAQVQRIPSAITVGKTRYQVTTVKMPPRSCQVGEICPEKSYIHVSTTYLGKPRSKDRQMKTFWHEYVHALLYAADSKKWGDEIFVDRLAVLMHNSFKSAVFSGD